MGLGIVSETQSGHIVLSFSLFLSLFNKWPGYLIKNVMEKIMSYHRLFDNYYIFFTWVLGARNFI